MKNIKGSTAIIAAIGIFALLFTGYALFHVLKNNQVYTEAADTYTEIADNVVKVVITPVPETSAEPKEQSPITVDFDALQKTCKDGIVAGWLYCDDDVINYPIAYSPTDNYFYLDHLITGEYNISGSLYIDISNSPDWTDRNTIIYGHHMGNGTMFGSLKKYRDQTYAEEHPVMWLNTPAGDYKLEYVGCYVTETLSSAFTTNFSSDYDFSEYIKSLSSWFFYPAACEVGESDQIISLVTCSYETNNSRQVTVFRMNS